MKAVSRFKGGKIKLARVDEGTSRFWVNYDNILVTKGKLQSVPPRAPQRLYVSQSKGNDSFEGTESKPYKTIGKAIENSYPGDEIIVEDGVYNEQISFLSNRVYGEEGKRLTIRARNRHKAVISGPNLKYGNYVTLDGFEVTDAPITVGGSTGSEVINNYIHDIKKSSGIVANGVNCRIAGNYIYKANKGITVSGTNMLVENNEIERLIDTGADADYFRFFGEGHVIRGNYMHGTLKEEIGNSHVDGFQTFDNNGEYARHIIIEGNIVEDFYHQGFMGEGKTYYHSYDITFRNNIFKDATAWGMCISTLKDVKVYNNLFINMGTHGVGFRGSDDMPATGEVRNNIFYNARNCYFGLESAQYASNNLLFNSNPYQKYDQNSFPNDIVNVDPMFIDIENNDFTLQPCSPAIDRGISLDFNHDFAGNKRPFGKGWDIGPFEAQGSNYPVAYISFSNIVNSTTGYEPLKTVFDGSLSYAPNGGNIVSYNWDFGDGSSASGVKVQHVFPAGKHKVKLTVTDNNGKKHTAEKMFNVLESRYPNLYLYLPFEGNLSDMSGKGMNVTAGEGIIFENSVYGKSVRFNNDKSRGISVVHNDYLDGLDEITIAFFAKKDSAEEAETVILKHTIYRVELTASGFGCYIYTNGKQNSFSVKNVVKDTGWHHYAVTYDGENIVMYLDGKECSRVACSGKINRDAGRAVIIGRNPWGDSLEGLMDEIRIYDRALSEDEIGQIMKQNHVAAPDGNAGNGTIPPDEDLDIDGGTPATPAPDVVQSPTPVPEHAADPGMAGNDELVDIKGHWAEDVIRKWVSKGLVKGYGDGRFCPENNITRAEFVTLLNKIFGYRQKSNKSFPDVRPGAWYAAEIAIAYQAGIIVGDQNGNMNPQAPISRQEAAVILCRAFSLEGDYSDAALKYADGDKIAHWALASVGIMTKMGYVTGRPGNLFAPGGNLTRSEAVKMIDNVMGELINVPGTYTMQVNGNLVISSPGVTLKDTYIAGDLYLTESAGSDIKLIEVEIPYFKNF